MNKDNGMNLMEHKEVIEKLLLSKNYVKAGENIYRFREPKTSGNSSCNLAVDLKNEVAKSFMKKDGMMSNYSNDLKNIKSLEDLDDILHNLVKVMKINLEQLDSKKIDKILLDLNTRFEEYSEIFQSAGFEKSERKIYYKKYEESEGVMIKEIIDYDNNMLTIMLRNENTQSYREYNHSGIQFLSSDTILGLLSGAKERLL